MIASKLKLRGDNYPASLLPRATKTRARDEARSKKQPFHKPLPTRFRRDGFDFRQIAREGNAAIYEQTWSGCDEASACYEVIRIRRRDGFRIGDRFHRASGGVSELRGVGRGRLHGYRQRRGIRKAKGGERGMSTTGITHRKLLNREQTHALPVCLESLELPSSHKSPCVSVSPVSNGHFSNTLKALATQNRATESVTIAITRARLIAVIAWPFTIQRAT